ncbi:hypothetical protein BH24BAC1_BH24BAC1_33040 [soil metagenome]
MNFKSLLLFVPLLLLLFPGRAPLTQTSGKRPNPNQLRLTWEVVEERYQNRSQTLSAIPVHNTSHEPLPAQI